MKPAVAMPMSDSLGLLFPHLKAITPLLKTVFERAFVSVPAATRAAQADYMDWLAGEDFFQAIYYDRVMQVGEDFLALYQNAAASCPAEQVIHLCYVDRVAYALQSGYRDSFIADMQATCWEDTPLIFHRSEAAWETHPANYRRIEQFVTTVGELVFGQTLDFAWCHLAAGAGQLREILPQVKNPDLSMVAEMVLLMREGIRTKEVDWLAWEDPFIFARDAQALKQEREGSEQETRKRLSYAIPMLQLLYAEMKHWE